MDLLKQQQVFVDALRIRAFPFGKSVEDFIIAHNKVFVIEQNRDAQMKSLLLIELSADPNKLISILNYDGMPITADHILKKIKKNLSIPSLI